MFDIVVEPVIKFHGFGNGGGWGHRAHLVGRCRDLLGIFLSLKLYFRVDWGLMDLVGGLRCVVPDQLALRLEFDDFFGVIDRFYWRLGDIFIWRTIDIKSLNVNFNKF
jgi:hypothetical protein